MPVTPARAASFDILLRVFHGSALASDLLNSPALTGLSQPDHGLCTEIVLGICRWRSVLEESVGRLRSDFSRLDDEVKIALLIGAYQLVFLDRIPASAAVSESVELVKRARKRSAAGLVNAVLRRMAASHPDRESLNPESAHPAWLADRWKREYGPAVAAAICAFDQQRPPTSIRIAGGPEGEQTEAEILKLGLELEPGRICRGARLVVHGNITATAAFREGRVAVQDEASQLVALLIRNGTRILDCCAAPGGKTSMIAATNPGAKVVAAEIDEGRLQLLRKRVTESNVEFVRLDARQLPFSREFDCILADVPCSGSGTLARNPEIRWRVTEEDLPRFAERQREILASALGCLAPGGLLIYSTCSLEREENQEIVEAVLAKCDSAKPEECSSLLQELEAAGEIVPGIRESLVSQGFLRTNPGIHDCDGFFAAAIRRTA